MIDKTSSLADGNVEMKRVGRNARGAQDTHVEKAVW